MDGSFSIKIIKMKKSIIHIIILVLIFNSCNSQTNENKKDSIKDITEQVDIHDKESEMGYAGHLHNLMNQISKGEINSTDLRNYFEKTQEGNTQKGNKMTFPSNNDENSWNGTAFEKMTESYEAMAVFSFVVPGMPLIYNGQEAGLDKFLKFFEKDTIEWEEHKIKDLYANLIALKNENKALSNGEAGSPAYFINTSNKEQIFTFKRIKDDNRILIMMNLSGESAKFRYMEKDFVRAYIDYFTEEEIKVDPLKHIILKPWEYKVLIEKK